MEFILYPISSGKVKTGKQTNLRSRILQAIVTATMYKLYGYTIEKKVQLSPPHQKVKYLH